jgi:hypothetical protein
MMRPDLRMENPWVRVDNDTWQILLVGNFEFINNSKVNGHTMTLSLYNQIIEERNENKTFELAQNC